MTARTPTRKRDAKAALPADFRRRMFGSLVAAELDRAYAKHGRERWSRHEFYAILLEEVEELWDAIKGDEPMDRVESELVQVAAMCFRYFETCEHARAAVLGRKRRA